MECSTLVRHRRRTPISALPPERLARYVAAHRKLQRLLASRNAVTKEIDKKTLAIQTLQRELANLQTKRAAKESDLEQQRHKCWKAWEGFK